MQITAHSSMGLFSKLAVVFLAIGIYYFFSITGATTPPDYAALDAKYKGFYVTPVGNKQYLVVVVNPFSGTSGSNEGASALDLIIEEFQQNDVAFQVVFTRKAGHGEIIARKYAGDPRVRGVVGVGGDGSISDVARGLLNSGVEASKLPILGLVPAGTGNGMVFNMIATEDTRTAIRVIVGAHSKFLDAAVLKANGKLIYAVHNTFNGLIVDTNDLSEKFRWMGNFRYTFAAMLQIAFPKASHTGKFDFTLPDGSHKIVDGEVTIMMLGVDGPYSSSDMNFWPTAKSDDGLLDACIFEKFDRMKMINTLNAVKDGTVDKLPFIDVFKFKRLDATGATGSLTYDGEPPMGEVVNFSVEVVPEALRVFSPE